MVERLVQNSKNGHLLTCLSADKALNKCSGVISKKFGHLKRGMGLKIESAPSTAFGHMHNEVADCKSQ